VIKKSIKEYFDRLIAEGKDYDRVSKVPYSPRIPSEMYVGTEDGDGYIYWQLIERMESIDKEILSQEIGFEIHESLLEFINCYFFLDISGLYKDLEITFDSITSSTNIGKFILRRCENLSINRVQIRYIQIGVITKDNNDNLIMCFDNTNGQIVLYDYDKEMIQFLSNSLSELIRSIKPRC